MKALASALAIAATLASLESAIDSGDLDTAKGEVETLHEQLRVGLYQHGESLGLTRDEIAQVDNAGPQARGGEPKDAPAVAETQEG